MPRLKIALKAKNIQNTFFDIEQMMLKLIKRYGYNTMIEYLTIRKMNG
jgi:hypothetical protein